MDGIVLGKLSDHSGQCQGFLRSPELKESIRTVLSQPSDIAQMRKIFRSDRITLLLSAGQRAPVQVTINCSSSSCIIVATN